MAVIQSGSRGRNFTVEELIGRRIRIEDPYLSKKNPTPIGHAMRIIADDEQVDNVLRLELNIEPCSVVEAKLTLFLGTTAEGAIRTEEITLRDNIEVSFSAIASEVY